MNPLIVPKYSLTKSYLHDYSKIIAETKHNLPLLYDMVPLLQNLI